MFLGCSGWLLWCFEWFSECLWGLLGVVGVFWWLLWCFEWFSECFGGVLDGCYGVLSGFFRMFVGLLGVVGVFWVVAMVF